MFLCAETANSPEGRVALLGEFVKMENGHIIVRSCGSLYTVLPKTLNGFKTKLLLVVGEMRDNILHEDYVRDIENEFDLNSFQRLAKVSAKYPELF